MLHSVFISYSRRDSSWVDALVADLTRQGVRCWIDREGIPFSVPWREEVEDAVQACDLFLVCDSEHWRTSSACATEAAYAVTYGKVRLDVPVGRDVGAAAEETARAWRQAARRHGTATELAVRARDWDADGRTHKGLAHWRLRRKFDALRRQRDLSAVESAYIAASRRRTRRQSAVSGALTLLLLTAYLSGRVAPGVEKEVNRRLAVQADRFTDTRTALALIQQDPYRGLQLAAGLGSDESVADAEILEAALGADLPDDAFTLPVAGRRFADPAVGALVRVTAGDGTTWQRAAADRTRREAARAPAGAAPGVTHRAADAPAVRWQAGSARIQVFGGGEPLRTVVLPAAARGAARISPDQRWVAVPTDAGVALVSVSRGTVRDVLTGAHTPVTDVVWAAKGDRVWGLAGTAVLSWNLADGQVLLDRPGEWFTDLLPAGDPAHLWVTGRDGQLRLLDADSGEVVRTVKVQGGIGLAAGDPAGRHAAVTWSLEPSLHVVDLATGTAAPVALPSGCHPGRPGYAHDGRHLYVPCLQSDVLVVDAGTLRVTGRIGVPAPGVTALAPAPSGDGLFLATLNGEIYSAAPGSAPVLLHRVGCAPDIEAIATAPGPRILPVGTGTGVSGCTQLARPQGHGGYHWDSLMDAPPDSVLALGAAYDPTGEAFAIGYSDGTLVLHPSGNAMPRQVLTHVPGGIRSLLTLPGPPGTPGSLYAATREGAVVRVPWCPSCLSNKAMAKAAGLRLLRDRELGLTTLRPPATPTPRTST
ncbi:toll/interleukin-1 receptor domain-containing protein [Actinacidiphila bryophytorum]|uniref:TIR domain-containing protein n=1 Tax=Actinacidiphila bryophytorum TaxID=1436133 RepID=A0A9W4H1X9_9ACTN|nr:TIR domain-containing protein [Actinacidiphila bryophytorum]MBM9435231.1 TIR domain-containing protein [Actinacidiphila bryophytorum]MBN6546850.1 TIR domain-containing protein [Actinacidiphila bryophytorum]CAG7643846.1 putative TIR domain-containing protein [Actinacidiphila bryophytorum]